MYKLVGSYRYLHFGNMVVVNTTFYGIFVVFDMLIPTCCYYYMWLTPVYIYLYSITFPVSV